jgi:chemotaxis signal transduction protein
MFRDGTARLLVFGVGAERFAVALSSVDEVIDAPLVRAMPDSASAVLGVAAVRGALVTIYDPRPLLNVAGSVDDAALLFLRDERRVGVAVGALYDTIVAEEGELRSAPGADASDKVLLGVIRRGSELIAVLDADALLAAAMPGSETQGERT